MGPHAMETFRIGVEFFDRTVEIGLWDWPTTADESIDRLRPLSYGQTDVFIVCFAIPSRESFESVATRWIPEIQRHCPSASFMLVGTKADLRDESANQVQERQGSRLAKQIQAAAYVECSARTPVGLDTVAFEAVRAVLGTPGEQKKKDCRMM